MTQGHDQNLPPINMNEQNPIIIRQYIFITKPVGFPDILPFILVLIVYCIIVQFVFTLWKKTHQKSFDIFLLILIFIFPAILIFILQDYYFLVMWLGHTAYLLYLGKIAYGFNSNKNAPKYIYNTFKAIFTVTNHAIFFEQFLVVMSYFFLVKYLLLFFRMLIYSIYFAVLSREVIRNLSIVMAKATKFYSKEGIPGRAEDRTKCMICTDDLSSDKIITLSCNHSYHEDCIMGYCVIGNNQCCQFCKQGIKNDIFQKTYWLNSEMLVRPIMNTMRSSISFFIVILTVLLFKSEFLGKNKD
jgi:RING finger protein 121